MVCTGRFMVLQEQGQVEGRRGVGQRADRDVVYARLAHSPKPSRRDAAGRLELRAAGRPAPPRRAARPASCCRAGAAAPRLQRLVDLRRGRGTSTSSGRSGRAARARAAPPRPPRRPARDVVLLDQDRVVAARRGGSRRRPRRPRPSRARAARAWSCACRGSARRVALAPPARTRAVAVATPDRRPRKFSAVRSAVSSARAEPSTRSDRAAARATRPPAARRSNAASGRAGGTPPRRPVEPEDHARRLLRDRRARPRRPAATVASVVTSPRRRPRRARGQ